MLVYESHSPKFAILKGRRFQWILALSWDKKSESWTDRSYYPTLSMLLQDLAEIEFRNKTKMLKTISELEKSIDKVYNLISKIGKDRTLMKNE